MVYSHISIMVFESFGPIYRAYRYADSPDSGLPGSTGNSISGHRSDPPKNAQDPSPKMYFSIVALNAFERIDPSPK